jgi:hypothetical protein
MARDAIGELATRRNIEDQLLALGTDLEQLASADSFSRERIRKLVGPAREVGVTVRDISRMTGLSAQTLHTWNKDLMRPIPDVHFGLAGPQPISLDQAVLRVIGLAPDRDWTPDDVVMSIPEGWPTGPREDIADALERLARGHLIWDGELGYRVAPPSAVE